jgi:hypothetical protein
MNPDKSWDFIHSSTSSMPLHVQAGVFEAGSWKKEVMKIIKNTCLSFFKTI